MAVVAGEPRANGPSEGLTYVREFHRHRGARLRLAHNVAADVAFDHPHSLGAPQNPISVLYSFFGTMQLELLDRKTWDTRAELASAIFEWIEGWYNPQRRHTSIDDLSPIDYERRLTTDTDAA